MTRQTAERGRSKSGVIRRSTQGGAESPVLRDSPALPGAAGTSAKLNPAARVESLLRRMRQGDRDAAAEFMTLYESRIRRRIRGKLDQPMRRLFDSEEIMSTVTRRLDLYVSQGRLAAVAVGELWSLVFHMADHALADKLRVFQRLETIEGSDGEIARLLLERLKDAESQASGGAEIQIEKALNSLTDPEDRMIVLMWLDGCEFKRIAAELGQSAASVRKRWERIRSHLRTLIRKDLL